MKNRTVKELRAAAKARGIRGYSKLSKEALVHALDADAGEGAPQRTHHAAQTGRAARATTGGATAAEPAPEPESPAVAPAQTPVAPESVAARASFASTEQLVEDAKYALRPPGSPAALAAPDLDEDIERLPELTQPVVALLPQKPSILHAYWVLPPGETARREGYALRLCRGAGDTLDVQQEIAVREERGSWYFHLPAEGAEHGTMLVQLGYYEHGRFVNAGGRSQARLPSLYASTRTDQRWWIDEAEFMRMYLRAGGFVTPGQRFGWAASIGSPAAPGVGPDQRLAWPGGVGSPPSSS